MRRLLLWCLFLSFSFASIGQGFSLSTLLEAAAVPKLKFDAYISKKGFALIESSFQADTIARDFEYRSWGKKKEPDSPFIFVKRAITTFSTKEDFSFNYLTTSLTECQKLKGELKKEGFFCNAEKDSLTAPCLLFQSKDVTITLHSKVVDTLTEYSFLVRKQVLPKPKEIVFAEDLAVFNSHEYLRYYFGDKNVKKDIYYLSERQIGKCTVLFPNTNRQVVFLWADGVNDCRLSKMYIGGQLMAESSLEYDKNVAQNIWQLKSGIHAGMSLYSLRLLNDASFNFYGGNSSNTGMVFTDSTGKINFKSENIILGCMNCTDPKFLRQTVVNSDEAIGEERILFVHTIIFDPAKKAPVQNQQAKN